MLKKITITYSIRLHKYHASSELLDLDFLLLKFLIHELIETLNQMPTKIGSKFYMMRGSTMTQIFSSFSQITEKWCIFGQEQLHSAANYGGFE